MAHAHAILSGLLTCMAFVPAACAHRVTPPALVARSSTWSEREVAVRQTWDELLRARAARDATAAPVQAQEAALDIVRQMPRVSVNTGGAVPLAEAVDLLLTGTGYSVEYEPSVDVRRPVAAYVAHQRLDEALATVVHPLRYTVEVEPLPRRLRVATLQSRTWHLSTPATDEVFWAEVRQRLTTLVQSDGTRLQPRPGLVVIDRDAGVVTVSGPEHRMASVVAYMTQLTTSSTSPAEAP